MEGRQGRSRGGGSWKRGGHGGNDGDRFGGDRRGRGGHYRGRGKRDHGRGRGRTGDAHATEFLHRNQVEEGDFHEEGQNLVFSRRKLESNWDRYEDSEKEETPEDIPTIRGTDYHVLLGSAGDCFTQFRFSEERDWEKETFSSSQMSTMFVDLQALAQSLEQVPLHQRLNLEAELVQVSTPVNLPAIIAAPKQEMPKLSSFTSPSVASKVPSTTPNITKTLSLAASSDFQPPSSAVTPSTDDVDEELDQLLTLAKPLCPISRGQSVSVESTGVLKEFDTATEVPIKEEAQDDQVAPTESASVRKEMTEEDLEDWLDSMIS
ncbi:cell death regulator Aven [Corythoichthys intestinalis]|uniref:cell death regulator Aven n=1 Tax=Corythoichthys intestinalis TaxID=161448 RepID=UPI0025A5D8AB|nr:cell death regulator Aven [Corythoichthys intestinalis]XP_057679378.1 cell death regulator Aven [Corythoichthys intestinalis]